MNPDKDRPFTDWAPDSVHFPVVTGCVAAAANHQANSFSNFETGTL